MPKTPENWRNRKELLWSGYFPGSKAVYASLDNKRRQAEAPQTTKDQATSDSAHVSAYLLQLLATASSTEEVVIYE